VTYRADAAIAAGLAPLLSASQLLHSPVLVCHKPENDVISLEKHVRCSPMRLRFSALRLNYSVLLTRSPSAPVYFQLRSQILCGVILVC
jgi:hypothetical protein